MNVSWKIQEKQSLNNTRSLWIFFLAFRRSALNPWSLSWLFSIKPRLKNYFVIFFIFLFAKKTCMIKKVRKKVFQETMRRWKGCIEKKQHGWVNGRQRDEGQRDDGQRELENNKLFEDIFFYFFSMTFPFCARSWNFSSSRSYRETFIVKKKS